VFENRFKRHFADEIFEDMLHRVRTPSPEKPDLENPETFKEYFERNNKHLGLYFTQYTMDTYYELLEDILRRLGREEGSVEVDARIELLEELLEQVTNPYSKKHLKERYVALLYYAKKVPPSRAQSYEVFSNFIDSLSTTIVDSEAKGREELQMPENFGFEVPREDQTEEEKHKLEEERKAKKNDWMKKNKKKPKPEEEEAKDAEELRNKVSQAVKKTIEEEASKCESQVELTKNKFLMANHRVMDEKEWDLLNRKHSLKEIDISSKDIVLRLDLDVPLTPYEPTPPPVEESISPAQKALQSK